MRESERPFQLYDGHIIMLLRERKKPHFRALSGSLEPFEDLQETELIEALVNRSYPKAMGLLRKRTTKLAPKDAAAACLCALAGPEALMHALLGHCPPIPEFQFLGVGKAASLLSMAARFNKHKMLALLLKRGANPNGDPSHPACDTPLETAFFHDSYLCLEQLLKAPALKPELTESILTHWGTLHADPDNSYPTFLWSCQLLLEAFTGQPTDPQDPLPVPSQLRLHHVLEDDNLELATHLCKTRPLTEEDILSISHYIAGRIRIDLLHSNTSELSRQELQQYIDFLLAFLAQCPHLLETPAMRSAVAATALATPTPHAGLQNLTAQLADGPILIKRLPSVNWFLSAGRIPHLPYFSLDEHFFPRWAERLGYRLIPTMDVHCALPMKHLSPDEIRLVASHVLFIGERSPETLSTVATQFMLYAPEDLIPSLLRPGSILSLEPPGALLDACQDLPLNRRNFILPHLHKKANYDL